MLLHNALQLLEARGTVPWANRVKAHVGGPRPGWSVNLVGGLLDLLGEEAKRHRERGGRRALRKLQAVIQQYSLWPDGMSGSFRAMLVLEVLVGHRLDVLIYCFF